MNACSAIKVDRTFDVTATYDDGDVGCTTIGRPESAVVGEVLVANGTLWTQYLGSTDGSNVAPVAYLEASDLTPICHVDIPALPSRGVAGFYQAPVIDEEGNAYMTAGLPASGMGISRIG